MKYITPASKSADGYYGRQYQEHMVEKYRNRNQNHRKSRIALAHRLVDSYALPILRKEPRDTTFLDVGCSIGTFPIEFAKRGFRSYGVDFSMTGIEMARRLAAEEGVDARFFCGDVAELGEELPPVDIVSCFDIFEHLHDDELGALLRTLRLRLSPHGSIIFHTYPTQYDYIFFGKSFTWWPLVPFCRLPPRVFTRIVKMFAAFLDIAKLALNGGTQRELVRDEAHCNTLTPDRLEDIFRRAGYDVVLIETANLIRYRGLVERIFAGQPIMHRDIQGVAVPR